MINWRYIKGLNQNNGGSDLYTFLAFDYKRNNTLTEFANTPSLYVNTTNAFSGATELGHIITQKATGQSINTPFTFTNTLTITGLATCNGHIQLPEQGYIYFHGGNSGYLGTTASANTVLRSTGTLYLDSNTTSTSVIIRRLTTQIAQFNSSGLSVTGNIVSSGKCEATYFNATSDSRAKTGLVPLSINALDLIKRVQLYSFKYKESDIPSIGILAQDIQDININGFKLVDNEEATGKNMDYMSIHESKLIYILWKAIQEQQKQIDELKAQLNK